MSPVSNNPIGASATSSNVHAQNLGNLSAATQPSDGWEAAARPSSPRPASTSALPPLLASSSSVHSRSKVDMFVQQTHQLIENTCLPPDFSMGDWLKTKLEALGQVQQQDFPRVKNCLRMLAKSKKYYNFCSEEIFTNIVIDFYKKCFNHYMGLLSNTWPHYPKRAAEAIKSYWDQLGFLFLNIKRIAIYTAIGCAINDIENEDDVHFWFHTYFMPILISSSELECSSNETKKVLSWATGICEKMLAKEEQKTFWNVVKYIIFLVHSCYPPVGTAETDDLFNRPDLLFPRLTNLNFPNLDNSTRLALEDNTRLVLDDKFLNNYVFACIGITKMFLDEPDYQVEYFSSYSTCCIENAAKLSENSENSTEQKQKNFVIGDIAKRIGIKVEIIEFNNLLAAREFSQLNNLLAAGQFSQLEEHFKAEMLSRIITKVQSNELNALNALNELSVFFKEEISSPGVMGTIVSKWMSAEEDPVSLQHLAWILEDIKRLCKGLIRLQEFDFVSIDDLKNSIATTASWLNFQLKRFAQENLSSDHMVKLINISMNFCDLDKLVVKNVSLPPEFIDKIGESLLAEENTAERQRLTKSLEKAKNLCSVLIRLQEFGLVDKDDLKTSIAAATSWLNFEFRRSAEEKLGNDDVANFIHILNAFCRLDMLALVDALTVGNFSLPSEFIDRIGESLLSAQKSFNQAELELANQQQLEGSKKEDNCYEQALKVHHESIVNLYNFILALKEHKVIDEYVFQEEMSEAFNRCIMPRSKYGLE